MCMFFWFSWTHCDGHDHGATGGVLRHSGDVILRRELGDVVVGVQQVDDNVGSRTEPFRSVDLHCQQLHRGGEQITTSDSMSVYLLLW